MTQTHCRDNRKRRVIVGRCAILRRPVRAISIRNLQDELFAQPWPTLEPRRNPFPLVLLGPGLRAGVPGHTLLADLDGIPHGHLAACRRVRGFRPPAFLFVQIRQPQLGDRQDIRLEALSDELATNAQSGIVTPE